jgi:toxin ParE1/3/4
MPRRRLEYAPIAELDLDHLFWYTARTWGVEQANRYSEELIEVVDRLADFPMLGRDSTDLGSGLRTLVVMRHIVVYGVFENRVLIYRVLNEREDIARVIADLDVRE